jgi:hypothetical protein
MAAASIIDYTAINILEESTNSVGNNLRDCVNLCSDNGICRNYVCYCQPEYTKDDCSISRDEDLQAGYPFETVRYYLLGAAFIGFVIGIIFIRIVLKRASTREYQKFALGERESA